MGALFKQREILYAEQLLQFYTTCVIIHDLSNKELIKPISCFSFTRRPPSNLSHT